MSAFISEGTQFVDTGGEPLVGGFVYIGLVNADPIVSPITIYSDRDLTVVLANPQTLDASGRTVNKIWIPARYSLKIEDLNNVQVYQELDNGEDVGSLTLSLTNVLGSNAITADSTPTITSYVTNQLSVFQAILTNTGAVTLNINGIGVKAITKKGALALSPGDIPINAIVEVVYDGTQFQIVGVLGTEPMTGNNVLVGHKSLVIIRPTVATVDIDADDVILENTSGGFFRASSVNLTLTITNSGADGLDTGTEAGNGASIWYHLWVIYNPTTDTIAGLFSLSSTTPTLPSGYTFKGLVGAIFNNSGSDLVNIIQEGPDVALILQTALSDASATTITSIDLSAAIPTTAKKVNGFLQVDSDNVDGTSQMELYADSAGVFDIGRIRNNGGSIANKREASTFSGIIITDQTVWYLVSSASDNGGLLITGWEF